MFKKTLLALVVLGLTFLAGAVYRHLQLPPYDALNRLADRLRPARTYLAEFDMDTAEIAQVLEETRLNSDRIRADLMEAVILPATMVSLSRSEPSVGEAFTDTEITARYYGIEHTSFLRTTPDNKGCLRIYVQGHGGSPKDFGYHAELRDAALEQGCDFLTMTMFGLGENHRPMSYPTGKYPSMTSHMGRPVVFNHAMVQLYHDVDRPEKDPLALMLSPHYHTIRSIIDDYDHVTIVGISGGGWYSVWMAALLEDIDGAIIYAGSLPNVYRTSPFFFGDSEEYASRAYRIADYWQLYQLGSYRPDAPAERRYYMVFNDRDPCCFMNPAAAHFSQVARELYGENFTTIIDESVEHAINSRVVRDIWAVDAPN